MTLAAADVVYAPDNSLGTDGATLVSNSAPQVNALQAIRSIVAYLVNLNLPAAQTADDIAIAIAADASALETLKEALETTADEFHSLSNMGIHSMFQDIDDWVTAAAGSPSSNLTTISSGQLGTDAVFGPEFQADSSVAAVTVYQRHAFRPRSGRVYRVTVTGSAEAANACTLTPIVAQLDDSYVVTTANKAASEALGFSAANTLQSVTFTMSVDVAGVDIDLDAVPYVRVGATIGPDSATSTNLRLVQILVEDVTEVTIQLAAAISASEIAAAFAADSSALESLKDIIVADLDSADAAAIKAALVAISAFGDVSGPASSANGNLPSFNGAGGKTLQDSGVASGSIVTGPASATNSNLAAFNGVTGKVLKDSAIAISAVATLSGAQTFTGAKSMSGAAFNTAQGADVASASTINLDTATGNVLNVSGITRITAVTLSQGRTRLVRFNGALPLTHGASLVLPSGADITTAAGDYAVFVGYAAGLVRVASYTRADGTALVAADLGSISTSGALTYPANGQVSWAHGQGAIPAPDKCGFYLVWKGGSVSGYVNGNVLYPKMTGDDDASGINFAADATNLTFAENNTPVTTNRLGSGTVTLTPSNVEVYLWVRG